MDFVQTNRGVRLQTRFDGISEFVSRRGRMRVLEMILEEFETTDEVAGRLDVTKRAVYGWIKDKKRHPSNENVRKLLKILKKENEEKLRKILIKELQNFQKLIINLQHKNIKQGS